MFCQLDRQLRPARVHRILLLHRPRNILYNFYAKLPQTSVRVYDGQVSSSHHRSWLLLQCILILGTTCRLLSTLPVRSPSCLFQVLPDLEPSTTDESCSSLLPNT